MTNKETVSLDIDRIIHEPARLKITTILRYIEEVDFKFLIQETNLTNGNLVSHLKKLEDTGYISIKKFFKGRRPCTMYRLTKLGIKQYDKYKKQLKQLTKKM